MSANALHLNLLTEQDRLPPPSIQAKALLPVLSGAVLVGMIVWGVVVAVQLTSTESAVKRLRRNIAAHTAQNAESESVKAKCDDLQAEAEQFSYYVNGRRTRGDLLRKLASVIPTGITLNGLSIPPPPPQELRPPPGVPLPPLQGTTQKVERVELRLTGLAKSDADVLRLMDNLKESAFTNDIVIVEEAADESNKSPRVLAFRQESSQQGEDRRQDVFFDIVYELKPREFAK